GRRAEPQQIWNLWPRVSFEVITVTELVMRSEKPTRIRFDALQRTNVVLKIHMPAGGVCVLLALLVRRHWIQIRFFPETLRQRREPEPGVRLLGSLDDPFRFSTFEVFVDVGRFNKARPFLRPAVV